METKQVTSKLCREANLLFVTGELGAVKEGGENRDRGQKGTVILDKLEHVLTVNPR